MSDAILIDPVRDLGEALLGVEKPARYTGGEYGMLASPNAPFRTAIAFPDLYEIGMSNQALRILYNRLNEIPGISCDRAFAPAPDFEALLRKRAIPLYGLDTGISLGSLDLLLFTLGYELGITSVLTMLDLAGIPVRREQRGKGDPIVIMGGPCVSNPLPYAAFIDAFWIGEAEAGFFELVETLAGLKGEGREGSLRVLRGHPHIWTWGKAKAQKAVDYGFTNRSAPAAVFPVPSMKVVQHHGAVEIMRGCPNGCRFCHAGYWYRPMRQKNAELIAREAEEFIRKGGYREISLSSLSSGDYRHLDSLSESLNCRFSASHVSFQLPSLKVSTFSLSLLEKISLVRKSGLTFAVETPRQSWQMSINKEVSLDSVTAILGSARKNGWRGAKFYFMIGLPAGTGASALTPGAAEDIFPEARAIVSFVLEAARRTGMRFNINVGVFVPKPHTPYQRVPQIGIEDAEAALNYIRGCLKPSGHKVGVSDPLVSLIEGVLSRGDERTSALIEKAWRAGCRLDAWQDEIKKDVWREVLSEYPDQVYRIKNGWEEADVLPWELIESGVSGAYLSHEHSRSLTGVLTSPCMENCTHPCGVCDSRNKIIQNNTRLCDLTRSAQTADQEIVQNTLQDKLESYPPERGSSGVKAGTHRLIFSFEKTGAAVFHAHLSVLEIFSMAFVRADIPVSYSEGFNPLPRLEVVAPLSLGIASLAEIAAVDTVSAVDAAAFTDRVNRCLPLGFTVTGAETYYIPAGQKKYSLSSLLWGFEYLVPGNSRVTVPKDGEKEFRVSLGKKLSGETANNEARPAAGRILSGPAAGESAPASFNPAFYNRLKRRAVLARDPSGGPGESYFDVFRRLYPETGPGTAGRGKISTPVPGEIVHA
jgi:radical SAM superfamily enzyme YgiQ (UPF0313 family)